MSQNELSHPETSSTYGGLGDMALTRLKYVKLSTVREALALVGRGLHPDVAIVLASRYLEADRKVTDEQVAEAVKALRQAQEIRRKYDEAVARNVA